jgi:hypothetical protein
MQTAAILLGNVYIDAGKDEEDMYLYRIAKYAANDDR